MKEVGEIIYSNTPMPGVTYELGATNAKGCEYSVVHVTPLNSRENRLARPQIPTEPRP